MIDEKKFARLITKMFNKKTVIRNITEYVTDGWIMYKGDLVQDVYYRLRLESDGQQTLLQEKAENIFKPMNKAVEASLILKYNLPREDLDVYIAELKNGKEYRVVFNKRYRPLLQLPEADLFIEMRDIQLPTMSPIYAKTPYGDVIVMPAKIDRELIYV